MQARYPLSGPFDVIFFRNVMIYFDKPTQQQVIGRQCQLLRPEGYLFTSHTETIAGLDLPLRPVADATYMRLP
jgi:chemotaxis protein methyltransferase CheR